jgi:hypothetical protein
LKVTDTSHNTNKSTQKPINPPNKQQHSTIIHRKIKIAVNKREPRPKNSPMNQQPNFSNSLCHVLRRTQTPTLKARNDIKQHRSNRKSTQKGSEHITLSFYYGRHLVISFRTL